MIPGKMNSREMKRLMAQMGIKSTDMTDVTQVIMKGKDKDYIIDNAQVQMIEAQGVKSFQILGSLRESKKESEPQKAVEKLSDDDIKLVMDQTGVSREKAEDALRKAEGEPAQAIMDLKQNA